MAIGGSVAVNGMDVHVRRVTCSALQDFPELSRLGWVQAETSTQQLELMNARLACAFLHAAWPDGIPAEASGIILAQMGRYTLETIWRAHRLPNNLVRPFLFLPVDTGYTVPLGLWQ